MVASWSAVIAEPATSAVALPFRNALRSCPLLDMCFPPPCLLELLDSDPIKLNRIRFQHSCLSMIFSENSFHFSDLALESGASLRVEQVSRLCPRPQMDPLAGTDL